MKTLFTYLTLLLFASSNISYAQNYTWAKSVGGTGSDYGNSLVTDQSGNVYVTGKFEGTVDFDPSLNTYTLTSNGSTDIYVAKFDSSGNFQWAFGIGNVVADAGNYITLDGSGNILVTGNFQGNADFNPLGNTVLLAALAYDDAFLAKYDPAGKCLWAFNIKGAGYDYGYSITTDLNDEVYLLGRFNKNADFDPSANSAFLTSTNNSIDVFISKYDSAGKYIWAKNFGGKLTDLGTSVALDNQSHLYVTGYFQDTADFDPSGSVANLISSGSDDIFIARFDTAGNYEWAKGRGGIGNDHGNSVSTDANGNPYISGEFSDMVDFDPGNGQYLLSNGSTDIFILKLNSLGDFQWAHGFGGASLDYSKSLKFHGNSVYVSGSFFGTVDFDPSSNTNNLTSSSFDIVIARYDEFGKFDWAKNLGGTNTQDVNCLSVDASKKLYITGFFTSNATFDGNSFSSSGIYDVYIAKYADTTCANTYATINATACNSYISPSGSTITNSGTYAEIIPKVAGCDSILTLNITINTLDTSVSVSSDTLIANEPGATYQWFDCDNSFSVIGGATNQTYSAASGNYAVLVTKNGCSDTSTCYSIGASGIFSNNSGKNFIIYPNPVKGTFTIDHNTPEKNISFEIFDLAGRIIKAGALTSKQTLIDFSDVEKGVYFLKIDAKTIPFVR